MNLNDMERLHSKQVGDQEDVCCIFGKDEDPDEKLNKCVDLIFRNLFGAGGGGNEHQKSPHTKKLIGKVIKKELDLEHLEELGQDLGITLDYLEASLFLFERILAKIPHILGVDLVDHMEEIQEHLTQWGMGDQVEEEDTPPAEQDKSRFLDSIDPDSDESLKVKQD